MNVLSLLSYAVFVILIFFGFYSLKQNPKNPLNRYTFFECLALGIWAFAATFFYIAPNEDAALFWSKIGCIGGILFAPFAVYFFLILGKKEYYFSTPPKKVLYYFIPILLMIKNFTDNQTFLASGFIQSTSGLGWTFVNSFTNLWTWIYFLFLFGYYSFGLYILFKWRSETHFEVQKKQATAIISINIFLITFGIIFEIVLPILTNYLPPITNITVVLFVLVFYRLTREYQLFSFSSTTTSDIVLNTIMDPVLLLDEQGNIIRCNAATGKLLKYDSSQLIGKPLNLFLEAQSYNKKNIDLLKRQQSFSRRETKLITSDQNTIHAIISATIAVDSSNNFVGIVVTFQDITQLLLIEEKLLESRQKYKELANKLYIQANFDSLTQLPNRRVFFKSLNKLAKNYPKKEDNFSVIYLDLNGFKNINDQNGHDVGDMILIETAHRLKTIQSNHEIVTRMGGDEFTIILTKINSEQIIINKIKLIKSAFSSPFIIGSYHFNLSISAGYACYSQSGHNLDSLIRSADQMMYADKAKQKRS